MTGKHYKTPLTAPTPGEIRASRKAAKLKQREAGALVYTTCRTWQRWEEGSAEMHPAIWELFTIKTGGQL